MGTRRCGREAATDMEQEGSRLAAAKLGRRRGERTGRGASPSSSLTFAASPVPIEPTTIRLIVVMPGSIKLSPMEGPLLRNLEKDMFDFKFTVRIGRIWEHWSADSSTLYCLDYVMVDHKGGTTEGSVPKGKMAKFKDKFHEGVVFTIQRYQIFRARDKYTTVDHPFRISFVGEHWQSVVPEPSNFPMVAYNTLPFSQLEKLI